MKRILIVDGSPVMYAQWSKVGHLKTTTGIMTGLRYGFLRSVRAYASTLLCDKVVIVWDSKGAVVKAEGRPEYKANRPWTTAKASMYSQLDELKQMLGLTTYTQAEAAGYEADDLIGTLTRSLEKEGHDVWIVTPDHDMLQLVSDNVTVVWKGTTDKGIKWTKQLMMREKGIGPKGWLLYKAMQGDKSDNLTAAVTSKDSLDIVASLLKGLELTEQLTSSAEENLEILDRALDDPSASIQFIRNSISAVKSEILQNIKIMALTDPPDMVIKKGLRDKAGLTKLFVNLEFKSMMQHIDELTKPEPVE